MSSTILIYIAIVSGFLTLVSGLWALVETYWVFRIHLTRSLNATLDIIKVVKPFNKDQGNQTSDRRSQIEKEEISVMEHLLTTLSDLQNKKNVFHRLMYGDPQLVFEISVSSDNDQISFYIAMPSKYQELVEKQVHSFYPTAHIERIKDYTIFKPDSVTLGSYLTLKKDHKFPIRTYQRMESDPLHNITNALSKLEDPYEGAAIQYVIKRSKSNWRMQGQKIAQKMQQGKHLDKALVSGTPQEMVGEIGKGVLQAFVGGNKDEQSKEVKERQEAINLTPEENDIIKQFETKANKAHFNVNIRLLASSHSKARSEEILASLENAFVQFEDTNLNKFKVIRDRSHNAHKLAFDFIFRNYRRKERIVLDTEELASVFHFPISTTETPKINWLKSKSAPPPPHVPTEGLKLGFSDYRGTQTPIRLDRSDRRRHLYIIGQTGTGKSAFIEEMVKQDVQNGEGCCVIDPHGDLIDHILECVPKERAEDIIYFDPSDVERPFGFNMLEYDANRPEQRTFVINEMIAIFDKLYDLKQTGGPMFEQYMRNALLLILDSPETGSTLMEVPRVFRDVEFRRDKLKRCKDMTVVDFWEKEAEKAGGDASLENISPYITSKLTTFISNDMMRPIISQQNSTLNFRNIMDNQKVLLVNLSKGKIGEINSHLLGMVIVGKLLMAALGRVDMEEDERKDFYLYIDEFQNFTTDSISQILAEARKYRLGLTIAHQFIGQLSENISKAVFGNVGSMCSFRIGSEDAQVLEKQFAPVFDANDLINLDNFNAYTKLLIRNQASPAFNMKTYPPTKGDIKLREAFKELSRYKYGRSRDIVEEEIRQRFMSVGG
jgi:hypothetical protein